MPPVAPPARRFKRLRVALIAMLGVLAVLGVVAAALVYKPLHRRAGTVVAAGLAPDFALTDANGASVSLASLTARGPAVLVFYRGFW